MVDHEGLLYGIVAQQADETGARVRRKSGSEMGKIASGAVWEFGSAGSEREDEYVAMVHPLEKSKKAD